MFRRFALRLISLFLPFLFFVKEFVRLFLLSIYQQKRDDIFGHQNWNCIRNDENIHKINKEKKEGKSADNLRLFGNRGRLSVDFVWSYKDTSNHRSKTEKVWQFRWKDEPNRVKIKKDYLTNGSPARLGSIIEFVHFTKKTLNVQFLDLQNDVC